MTRQEAIKILWQYDMNFEPHPAEDVMHAIDMAIEALEQEPSEDCISREHVLDKLNEQYKINRFKEHNDMANIGISQAESITENAPSVVPSAEQSSMVEEWESSIPLETEMAQVFRKVFGVDDDVPVVIKYPDEGSDEE